MIKLLRPRLPMIGHIKIGKKGELRQSQSGSSWRKPEKLPYFLITGTERDKSDNLIPDISLMESLKKTEGAKLDKDGNIIGIPIRLIYNDIDSNFQTRLASYSGSTCVCSGDGEKAKTNEGKEVACPCNKFGHEYTGKDKCKVNGSLTCILDSSDFFGTCYRFRTTSRNTAECILGSLQFISASTSGIIAFIPLTLILIPQSVSVKSETNPNTTLTTKIYVASIVPRGTLAELQKNVLTNLKNDQSFIASVNQIKSITHNPMQFESDEEEKDFTEEFYQPENQDEDKGNGDGSSIDNNATTFTFAPNDAPIPAVELPVAQKNETEPPKAAENPKVANGTGTANANGKISDANLKRVNTIIGASQLDRKEVHVAMKHYQAFKRDGRNQCFPYNVESFKDILEVDAAAFIDWLQELVPVHSLMVDLKRKPGVFEYVFDKVKGKPGLKVKIESFYQVDSSLKKWIEINRKDWEKELLNGGGNSASNAGNGNAGNEDQF